MNLLAAPASPHMRGLDFCKSTKALLPGTADHCSILQSRGKRQPRGIICSARNPDWLLLTHVVDNSLSKCRPEYHIVQMLILHPGCGAAGTAEINHCMLLDRAALQERLILARI